MQHVVRRLAPWLGDLLPRRPGPSARSGAANATSIGEADLLLLETVSDDVLCRVGADLRIRRLSPDAARLFARETGEMLGHPIDSLLHPDDAGLVAAAVAHARADATHAHARADATHAQTIAVRVHRPDVATPWIGVAARPVSNPKPDGAGDVVLVIAEINAHKGLRQRLATAAAGDDKRGAFEQALLDLTDGATGLANGGAIVDALDLEWARARRERTQLSLLLIGLDDAIAVDDPYLRARDEVCLRAAAVAVASVARRAHDLAGRLDGNELALLLPRTPARGAAHMAEVVRGAIGGLRLPHPRHGVPRQCVTASLGVATLDPREGDAATAPATLLRAVAAALEQARRTGPGAMVAARLLKPHSLEAQSLEAQSLEAQSLEAQSLDAQLLGAGDGVVAAVS
jgi:diguanylate cyclase (GGDEF)-like protein